MIVYHGTGRCHLESLISSQPRVAPRLYLGGRRAFSTTTDFKIAALFALRKSPPSVLSGDDREMGVVLEYEFCSLVGKGRKWAPTVEPGVLQDEKEIAIFKPEILEFRAVWFSEKDEWIRRKGALVS